MSYVVTSYGSIGGGTISIITDGSGSDTVPGDAGEALNEDFIAIYNSITTLESGEFLLASNNLSDVDDPVASCDNLGALQVSNNLDDVANPATVLANLLTAGGGVSGTKTVITSLTVVNGQITAWS